MYENIKKVGLPQWSDDDQTLAKALQTELKVPVRGLPTQDPSELRAPRSDRPDAGRRRWRPGSRPTGGGSDDIGDVSWDVPTVTLRYPVEHSRRSRPQLGQRRSRWPRRSRTKASSPGAKVQAMTMLDILLHPELVKKAWDYFNNVQTKDMKYKSFLRPDDKPAIWLNQKTMEQYRPQMKALYYDPSKYDTYLEQLGIKYPTVRPAAASGSGN